MLPCWVPVLFAFYLHGVLKFKCNSGSKRLMFQAAMLKKNMFWYVEIKRSTRCNRLVSLLQNLLFAQHVSGHHYAHHQELKSYADGCCLWYLALWFTGRWTGVELWNIPQTRHITHSSKPDQRPVNQSAKYHRQQPSA